MTTEATQIADIRKWVAGDHPAAEHDTYCFGKEFGELLIQAIDARSALLADAHSRFRAMCAQRDAGVELLIEHQRVHGKASTHEDAGTPAQDWRERRDAFLQPFQGRPENDNPKKPS